MNWHEAIKFFHVPAKYWDVTLDSELISPRIKRAVKRWLQLPVSLIERPSLYLWGVAGSGKTYVSYCILRSLVESGIIAPGGCWAIFARGVDIDAELLNATDDKGDFSVIRKYRECSILFLEDFGTEMRTERLQRQYFSIIDERTAQGLPTIYSANLAPASLATTFGDRLASRIGSAIPLEFPDVDLRKELTKFAIE